MGGWDMRSILIGLLAAGFWAHAEDFLKPFPSEVFTGEIFSVQTKPNYHFELKAPQRCDGVEAVSKSSARIQCRFREAGDHEVFLSVCDDKKTFCKPVRFSLKVTGKSGQATRASGPSSALQMAQSQMK